MFQRLANLLYPPKCVLCEAFLGKDETDFCHHCRETAPEFEKSKIKFSFIAGWTAVWYYKDNVRQSLLRYKFAGRRCYAPAYARILAMKLQTAELTDFDIVTWVPVAPQRRQERGYDQVEILAAALRKELGIRPKATLRKIRNTPPQSGILETAHRRANVLGAYRCIRPKQIRGKRILLLDDVITTGSTASECARTLLIAGAKEVYCTALAVANHNTK